MSDDTDLENLLAALIDLVFFNILDWNFLEPMVPTSSSNKLIPLNSMLSEI